MDLVQDIYELFSQAKTILDQNPQISKDEYFKKLCLNQDQDQYTTGCNTTMNTDTFNYFDAKPEIAHSESSDKSINDNFTNENETNENDAEDNKFQGCKKTIVAEKKQYIKTTKEWKIMESIVKKIYESETNQERKKELYDAVPKFLQISKKGKIKSLDEIPGITEPTRYFRRQIRGTKGQLIFKSSENELDSKIPIGFLFSDNSFIFFQNL